MSLGTGIVTILASVLSVAAAWYLNKKIVPWLQKSQSKKDEASNTKDRIATDSLNQKHQAESDRLKEIEGR